LLYWEVLSLSDALFVLVGIVVLFIGSVYSSGAVFMLSESLVVVVDSVERFSCIVFCIGKFEVMKCPLCGSGHC
jgi:hypothetical protein